MVEVLKKTMTGFFAYFICYLLPLTVQIKSNQIFVVFFFNACNESKRILRLQTRGIFLILTRKFHLGSLTCTIITFNTKRLSRYARIFTSLSITYFTYLVYS